jgi:carboxypeptidase Q
VQTYASWGIEAKNERVGTWRGWRRGHSHIDLVTPRVRSLEGTMLAYSPGTGRQGHHRARHRAPPLRRQRRLRALAARSARQARARLRAHAHLPPGGELDRQRHPGREGPHGLHALGRQREWAGPNVRGTGYSLALGSGSLGVRLEEAGVAGVITSRPKDAWGTIDVFESYNTKAPRHRALVRRLRPRVPPRREQPEPHAAPHLDAELLGEQPVFNTIGMIKGLQKPNEYVVLSAHFDSWDGGSGATDNGTGTLTMLEAMRILKQAYPNPKRTIVVGHWTAEEKGLVGSRAFTEDHPRCWTVSRQFSIRTTAPDALCASAAAAWPTRRTSTPGWASCPPSSSSSSPSAAPARRRAAAAMTRASPATACRPSGSGNSWNYGQYTWHTNRDTYDKVVFDEIKGNATIVAMLAYLASEEPEKVSRERVDLAARAQAGGAGGPPGAMTWPACQKAPRQTNPRLR